jgi:hypothetical protein
LQRAVAKGGLGDLFLIAFEPALGVGVRKQLGQVLIEVEVVADDGAGPTPSWSCRVAFRQMRLEPLLRCARLHKDEARRTAIG